MQSLSKQKKMGGSAKAKVSFNCGLNGRRFFVAIIVFEFVSCFFGYAKTHAFLVCCFKNEYGGF